MLAVQFMRVAEIPWLIFGAVALVVALRVDREDLPKVVKWLFPWSRR